MQYQTDNNGEKKNFHCEVKPKIGSDLWVKKSPLICTLYCNKIQNLLFSVLSHNLSIIKLNLFITRVLIISSNVIFPNFRTAMR